MVSKLPTDYAFPSGHTSASFATATAIFFSVDSKKWSIAAFILAVLISFSRIYVGVHYPTDVLGGIFTGVLSGYLADLIGRKIASTPLSSDKKSPISKE